MVTFVYILVLLKTVNFFGKQWEAQFEEAIKNLATESIGHLMVAIGTQLIFSGEDMHEFEKKWSVLANRWN